MQQAQEAAISHDSYGNDAVKREAQALFDRFDSNTISLFIARRDEKTTLMQELEEKEKAIMDEVFNSSISDIFMNMLIAEYKEQVYESIFFPYFEHDEYLHMQENERIIIQYYGEDTLYEHQHDRTHFMFDDGKHFYMFHEMIECKGESIFDYNDDDLVDD